MAHPQLTSYSPPSTLGALLDRGLRFGATGLLLGGAMGSVARAHGVDSDAQGFLATNIGINLFPYMYLGAKHMVTGYDHLLFLAGVIFFLYRLKDVGLYVTLFAVGHSTTLIAGVLGNLQVNPYLIDAMIGLSVVYKAFENIGGFRRLGWSIHPKASVLIFGLIHGLGLATKLQDLALSHEGLFANMIAFNVGVELGQFAALAMILIAINAWRASGGFLRHAYTANVAIMAAGFILCGYQLTGYVLD